MDFFRVLYSNDYAKKNGKFGIVNSVPELNDNLFSDGESFDFKTTPDVEFFMEGGPEKSLADFQMMYYPWRLISKKLYTILSDFSDSEMVCYHPVYISIRGNDAETFYLMHFLRKLDVLDKKKTGESLIQPVLDVKKMKGEKIFIYKEFDPSIFCVDKVVKDLMVSERITGCSFQKIS